MGNILVPPSYDYIAIYLTDRCPLRCTYCITEHNGTEYIRGESSAKRLSPEQWAAVFRRMRAPAGIPITLQGGEPLAYPGIWELLEQVELETDILTALPRNATIDRWKGLSLEARRRLRRGAPYPNVRVSYHVGQNKIEDLIPRVKEIEEYVSIGIYTVDHPATKAETERARGLCHDAGVFFRTKEYLGYHEGQLYGTYRFDDAVAGKVTRKNVLCRNTVLIAAPDGLVYRCHSDLYHKRKHLAVGSLLDASFSLEEKYRPCQSYGLCSECDVKIKTNHEQKHGYTSVSIKFMNDDAVAATGPLSAVESAMASLATS